MTRVFAALWVSAIAWMASAPAGVLAQSSCASAATTVAMQECAGRQASSVDSLRARIEIRIEDGLEFERLSEAQRARALWLEYREAQCRFESREAGTMSLVIYLRCHVALGAERIERISDLVCEGGGATGTCEEARDFRAALRRIVPE